MDLPKNKRRNVDIRAGNRHAGKEVAIKVLSSRPQVTSSGMPQQQGILHVSVLTRLLARRLNLASTPGLRSVKEAVLSRGYVPV